MKKILHPFIAIALIAIIISASGCSSHRPDRTVKKLNHLG